MGYISLAAAASVWIVSKQQTDLAVHGRRVVLQGDSYTSLSPDSFAISGLHFKQML